MKGNGVVNYTGNEMSPTLHVLRIVLRIPHTEQYTYTLCLLDQSTHSMLQ